MAVLKSLTLLLASLTARSQNYPELINVTWSTNIVPGDGAPAEPLVVQFNQSWAPIGVNHMWDLLQVDFYTQAAFFRVVPGFVVQFGIAGEPSLNSEYGNTINDDPFVGISNLRGTISYAMTQSPDSRSTQIFVNLANNSFLDADGFIVIGQVLQGIDLLDKWINNPTPGNSGGVNQQEYETMGNSWLLQQYPNISLIENTSYAGVNPSV